MKVRDIKVVEVNKKPKDMCDLSALYCMCTDLLESHPYDNCDYISMSTGECISDHEVFTARKVIRFIMESTYLQIEEVSY